MNEKVLNEFREEYNKRLEKKHKIDKSLDILKKRKEILENSPIVRDYIELNDQIEKVSDMIFTEEEVFFDTLYDFENKGLIDETNNIYLYAGSFINENGDERLVERDSLISEFDRYINIESLKDIDVPVEDRTNFEKNNKVLVLDNNDYIKYLIYDIRDQFIRDSLNYGQEDACSKVLIRNKKNY